MGGRRFPQSIYQRINAIIGGTEKNMAKNEDRRSIRCSFCGKPQSLVNRLIAGNGSYICDDCVRMCMQIVDDDPMTDTPVEVVFQGCLRPS